MLNSSPQQQKSELKPHELELVRKKALLAKVRVLRESGTNQANLLTGLNPAKVYIWVNVKEDRQMFFQSQGYELVTNPDVKSPYRKDNGSHQRADVVLYEIDRELYEAHQAFNQIRGLEGIEGYKNSAIAAFHREGVREFIPDVR